MYKNKPLIIITKEKTKNNRCTHELIIIDDLKSFAR